jgi:very-short-patch-repair endonuclease
MARRNPEALEFRRDLRRLGTEAERRLWAVLRRRTLGVKFRRQHSVGPYVLDFYCPAFRLAIELDGGQHARPEQAARDRRRDEFLASRRIRVVRFGSREFFQGPDDVIRAICAEVGVVDAPCPRALP